MNLSSIPNEIWNTILSNLELKDVVNFYKAYPTTIDNKKYDYINMINNSIKEDYICKKCIDQFRKNISQKLKKYIESNKFDIWYDNDEPDKFITSTKEIINDYIEIIKFNSIDDDNIESINDMANFYFEQRYKQLKDVICEHDDIFYKDFEIITIRNFIEICHKYNYIPKYNNKCICHDAAENIIKNTQNMIINIYTQIINSLLTSRLNICSDCGDVCYDVNSRICLCDIID